MSKKQIPHHFFKTINKVDVEKIMTNLLNDDELKLSYKRLSHASIIELELILTLIAQLDVKLDGDADSIAQALKVLFQGGHVQIQDDGALYNHLIVDFSDELRKRSSSHRSIEQQYSISGSVLKEVLFGVGENGKKTTWLQFERNNTRTIIDLILHLINYIQYKWTGKNIGPFGSSEHTDRNPLII